MPITVTRPPDRHLPGEPLARRRLVAGSALASLVWPVAVASSAPAAGALQVGPQRALRTLAEAARRARDGDTIEVDAGDYRRDVAVWTQDRLHLRAVGGRVRLLATGGAAEGKAIWVVRGGSISAEGFDFEGARVPDRNGAGIRFEAGALTLRDCRFIGNEMGLLSANDARAELLLERCEFADNRRPDGHNHQLYVGQIARLTMRGCYVHSGFVGHLVKSRAAVNLLYCNRITDESGGSASYEVEFPNGGVAVLVGNLVQQSSTSENTILISYGAEGYVGATHALALAHNTLVDKHPRGGVFLRVMRGEGRFAASVALRAVNNLLAGNDSRLEAAGPGDFRNNPAVDFDVFVRALREDWRLLARAPVAGRVVDPGEFAGVSLRPAHEYVHPRTLSPLPGPPRHPGALQTTG